MMSGIPIDILGWIIILIYTNHMGFLAKNQTRSPQWMDMWVARVHTLWESRDLSLWFIKAYSCCNNNNNKKKTKIRFLLLLLLVLFVVTVVVLVVL